MHSSTGASAYGATGKNGNSAAVGETANGDKYAAANGKTYSNTGSGWDQKSESPSTSSYNKSSSSGWGGQEKSGGSSAMNSGGGGWNSRSASARGSSSMGRSGGWGGRR
jgi:hypothetical protein